MNPEGQLILDGNRNIYETTLRGGSSIALAVAAVRVMRRKKDQRYYQ